MSEETLMTEFEIASIVISSISATATFCAVLVALWQSHVPYKKKLKLKSTTINEFGIDAFGHKVTNAIQKIQIKVLNVGHQDLEITSWGIYVSKNLQLNILNLNNASSSYLVATGKSINLCVPLSTLANNVIGYKDQINDAAKIRFFVQTNYGKTYLTKTNYRFSDFLN